MRTAYDILLSLTVTHSFFSDKMFESFELVPDNKTASIMSNLKLITFFNRCHDGRTIGDVRPFRFHLNLLADEEGVLRRRGFLRRRTFCNHCRSPREQGVLVYIQDNR